MLALKGFRSLVVVLALTAPNAVYACDTGLDPPNLSGCPDRSLPNASPPWGTISLDRAGAGLASTGSLSANMAVTRLPGAINTVIGQVIATRPSLGQAPNTVHANEDRSSWIELVLTADSAAGTPGAQLEWVRYGYQNGRITALASASSASFMLQANHNFRLSYQYGPTGLTVTATDIASNTVLTTLTAQGFGQTPPWFKLRWGTQFADTGIEQVQVTAIAP